MRLYVVTEPEGFGRSTLTLHEATVDGATSGPASPDDPEVRRILDGHTGVPAKLKHRSNWYASFTKGAESKRASAARAA